MTEDPFTISLPHTYSLLYSNHRQPFKDQPLKTPEYIRLGVTRDTDDEFCEYLEQFARYS